MVKIEDLITFIRQALHKNCNIRADRFGSDYLRFHIVFVIQFNSKHISLHISDSGYSIEDNDGSGAFVYVKEKISEKLYLQFVNLYLDVIEFNKTKAYNIFENFFNEEIKDNITINDLDSEDD